MCKFCENVDTTALGFALILPSLYVFGPMTLIQHFLSRLPQLFVDQLEKKSDVFKPNGDPTQADQSMKNTKPTLRRLRRLRRLLFTVKSQS